MTKAVLRVSKKELREAFRRSEGLFEEELFGISIHKIKGSYWQISSKDIIVTQI